MEAHGKTEAQEEWRHLGKQRHRRKEDTGRREGDNRGREDTGKRGAVKLGTGGAEDNKNTLVHQTNRGTLIENTRQEDTRATRKTVASAEHCGKTGYDDSGSLEEGNLC